MNSSCYKFPILIFTVIFVLLSSSEFSGSSSENYTGQVIDVADGDTITVLTSLEEKIKIRLAGVDCPEGLQTHGEEAKQFTSSLVLGKRVRIYPETTDKYGRTVAMIVQNGSNLSEQIIAHGHGWVFRKYCTAAYCDDWLKFEENARVAREGLWAENNPQSPWDWRAEHKGGNGAGMVESDHTAALLERCIMEMHEAMCSTVHHVKIITVITAQLFLIQ